MPASFNHDRWRTVSGELTGGGRATGEARQTPGHRVDHHRRAFPCAHRRLLVVRCFSCDGRVHALACQREAAAKRGRSSRAAPPIADSRTARPGSVPRTLISVHAAAGIFPLIFTMEWGATRTTHSNFSVVKSRRGPSSISAVTTQVVQCLCFTHGPTSTLMAEYLASMRCLIDGEWAAAVAGRAKRRRVWRPTPSLLVFLSCVDCSGALGCGVSLGQRPLGWVPGSIVLAVLVAASGSGRPSPCGSMTSAASSGVTSG